MSNLHKILQRIAYSKNIKRKTLSEKSNLHVNTIDNFFKTGTTSLKSLLQICDCLDVYLKIADKNNAEKYKNN